MSRGDHEFTNLLDGWILLKPQDHTIERLFDYWVRGRNPKGEERRWSVAHDAFGWFQRASPADPDE